MIREFASTLAFLAACALLLIGAVYVMPIEMPSSVSTGGEGAPETSIVCCTRCCIEVRINADGTYTMITSDCDTGRVCRVVSGTLTPKRAA